MVCVHAPCRDMGQLLLCQWSGAGSCKTRELWKPGLWALLRVRMPQREKNLSSVTCPWPCEQSVAELETQPGLPELSVQPSVSIRSFLFPFQRLSLPSAVLGC